MARVEVRVGRGAPPAQGHPVRIEALELVGEPVAVGRRVVQGRELEAEDLVAEPEADALRLVRGAGHRTGGPTLTAVSTTGGAARCGGAGRA